MWLLLLLACSDGTPVEPPKPAIAPYAVPPEEPLAPVRAGSLPLTRSLSADAQLELPPPADLQVPSLVSVQGFKTSAKQGYFHHVARAPFRYIPKGHNNKMPPVGFRLHGFDGSYSTKGSPDTWEVKNNRLTVRTRSKAPPKGLRASYKRATQLEDALVPPVDPQQAHEYVFRSMNVHGKDRWGALLPAPASATWDVPLPEEARFETEVYLPHPEVLAGKRSDGATARVVVHKDGEQREATVELKPGDRKPLTLDLADWGGASVRLELHTDPGGHNLRDHVFFADPVVLAPQRGHRVVMIFVDTLRPDHLNAYGYDRPTSPAIERFAVGATVFDEARTISPWTLPSARAALTGRQPEQWSEAPTIPGQLADAGFETTALITNAFLTADFDMARDWGTYHYDFLAPADTQVDRALTALDECGGQNCLVLVHFMDTHLPFREPARYRKFFAGEPPPPLDKHYNRLDLEALPDDPEIRDKAAAHLIDRYDQNIRFVDDELARLFEALKPEDIVVFYSDHGEEFWEHDGIEHGHALWEEVVRVPLIVRAPGMKPGRRSAPVNLLDIAPTLYELTGLEAPPETQGTSLVHADSPEVASELAARPTAIGRTLRDAEHWGVVHDGSKWITAAGRQATLDLRQDPSEANIQWQPTQGEATPHTEAMQHALDRPVGPVWHVQFMGPGKSLIHGKPWSFSHPEGLKDAFVSTRGPDKNLQLSSGEVTLASGQWPRELYLVSEDPNALQELQVRTPDGQVPLAFQAGQLLGSFEGLDIVIRPAMVPYPAGVAVPTEAAGMEDALKELGYLE